MADVLVILAHPDLTRSRVNRALLRAARALPADDVDVRDLYALYPDYVIDIEAEQAALKAARTVVWVHPIHWYSMPSLMKLWLDEVFAFRWAYGPGGTALAGKCLWLVVSTGGSEASYTEGGSNAHDFGDFLATYRQTARLVGMRFLDPEVFHGAHRAGKPPVDEHARAFGLRLRALVDEARSVMPPVMPEIVADERPAPGVEA
ncbi:MAG TPA: NAD(P)H-dependent oxidoreductase [Burkholderiaceae bacterium]|jgi:glutathione-regulated potassium-efflux system ancillary protein KefF|nr:NAD(P)H-dependent oxidoreductase [Burkholderiaceae bacterium]